MMENPFIDFQEIASLLTFVYNITEGHNQFCNTIIVDFLPEPGMEIECDCRYPETRERAKVA